MKAVLEESRSISLVSMCPLDTDQRQVPVRLDRPILLRHLDDRADILLHISGQAVRNDRFNGCTIAVYTRRKPNRDPGSVGGVMSRPCFERTSTERAEQSRDVQTILIRGLVHPTRDRVGLEGRNKGANSAIDLSVAADSRGSQVLHVGYPFLWRRTSEGLPIVTALLLLIVAATASNAMRFGIWAARVTSGFRRERIYCVCLD